MIERAANAEALFEEKERAQVTLDSVKPSATALIYLNDSAGHTVGDRLLQSVSVRLLHCVRNSDTVCRVGGDEFVILLCDVAHAQDAAVTAEKLLTALSEPHRFDQLELDVSASIGIVTFPEDGTTAEDLLENADAAMYQAETREQSEFLRNQHCPEAQGFYFGAPVIPGKIAELLAGKCAV